jgi:putative hydrolase of the HAD superfamily
VRLLLDLGGVVIKTPFEMLEVIGGPSWTGPFAPEADPQWRAMQLQEITEREYWSRRAREYFAGDDSAHEDPVRDLMRALLDHSEEEVVRPEMADFLETVNRPAVLTNDLSHFHPPEWIERMTILRLFDPLIDLSSEPYLKPDPRAFEIALQRLGEEAGNVLFVDDQPNNLRGAEEVGMDTVWFDVTDVVGSIERIRKALIGG